MSPVTICDVCGVVEHNPQGWFSVRETVSAVGRSQFCVEPFVGQPKHKNWKRVHTLSCVYSLLVQWNERKKR